MDSRILKAGVLLWSVVLFGLVGANAAEEGMHTFSNSKGEKLVDRIVKVDYEARIVSLARSGKVSIDAFSKADQDYILLWNQVAGFKTDMRFKMKIDKAKWGQLKIEQNVDPYFMDAAQVPGKQTPTHNVVLIEDFSEYNATHLEAEGYSLTLQNQNFYPIRNLIVESKVFYEQEYYKVPDDILQSSENIYDDVTKTDKVRYLSEEIPSIVPREKVTVYSECAPIINHQVQRNSDVLEVEEEVEVEEGQEDEDEEEPETEIVIETLADLDDHARERQGKLLGVWFRVGIRDQNGEMVWRDICEPSSVKKKFSWETGKRLK